MLARNAWNVDFGGRVGFADLGGAQTAWTGDRTEFLGRNGTLEQPAGLERGVRLSGRGGAAPHPPGGPPARVGAAPGGAGAGGCSPSEGGGAALRCGPAC